MLNHMPYLTRLTRRVPLVEQVLLTLPQHLSSTPVSSWVLCYSIFSFMCMFCRSLGVLFSFFIYPLCFLSIFDLRILITPLVSSNSSSKHRQYNGPQVMNKRTMIDNKRLNTNHTNSTNNEGQTFLALLVRLHEGCYIAIIVCIFQLDREKISRRVSEVTFLI